MDFKSKSAYKKWLAYGHASGEFAKTPGHQSVSIKGKKKKVKHEQGGPLPIPNFKGDYSASIKKNFPKFSVGASTNIPISGYPNEAGKFTMNKPKPAFNLNFGMNLREGGNMEAVGPVYTYAGRPNAKYRKSQDGQWMINLGKDTDNQYVIMDDPTGSRSNILNKQATIYQEPEQLPFAVQQFLAGTPKKKEENYIQGTPGNVPVSDNTQVLNLPAMPSFKKADPLQDQKDFESAVKKEFYKNRKWIEKKYGKDKVEKMLYNDEGNYDWNAIGQIMSKKDYAKDIEDLKYKDFQKREQEAYDNASWWDKGVNFTTAMLSDPVLTTQNLIFEGKGPQYAQWKGLNDDNPDKRFYERATGADDNWLNSAVNFVNPFYYTGEAVLADDPLSAGLNLTNALMLGRMGSTVPANVAKSSTKVAPYVETAPEGVSAVLKGNAPVKDLFKREDLVRFMDTEGIKKMRQQLSRGTNEPSDFMWRTSLQNNPDALKYAVQYGDDLMHIHRPMNKAAASNYKLGNLAKKLKNPNISAAEKEYIEDALRKTIPSAEDIANNPAMKKYYNSLPKETRNKIDKLVKQPESYWTNPIYQQDSYLQSVLANKEFFNTGEYLLPRVVGDAYNPISLSGIEGLVAPIITREGFKKGAGRFLEHEAVPITIKAETVANEKAYGGNMFTNGGVPNIPTWNYPSSGTPIYRDTAEIPPNNLKSGGYIVTRSNDRKGKTHKVTRKSDGKTEYYGHAMKNQPKNKKVKKAAEARHSAQGNFKNPFFKAYWDATWQNGGNVYEKGSEMSVVDMDPVTFARYIQDLKIQEGFSNVRNGLHFPYPSPEGGLDTVGYGHKLTAPGQFSSGLSEAEAQKLLETDVRKSELLAKSYIDKKYGKGTYDKLPQNSQMVLTDFQFNLGNLKGFPKFVDATVSGDKETMLAEYKRYYKDKSGETKEVKKRNDWTREAIENTERAPLVKTSKSSKSPSQDLLDKMKKASNISQQSGITTSRFITTNPFKYGGVMFNDGGQMGMPVTEFGDGGTHEENPLGGIPQGIGANGQPNLVEEGELKITDPTNGEDFIITNNDKMVMTKEMVEKYGLPKKYTGKKLNKIGRDILRLDSRRKGDSIEETSKQKELVGFIAAHKELTEMQNAKDAEKREADFMKEITELNEEYPEYMQALMGASQPQEPQMSPEEQMMMEQQMMAEQGMGGQPMGQPMSPEMGMMPMAYGGYMYASGGNMIKRADGSYSQRGLWDNIRAKRERGERMRKPGTKGAPTKKMFDQIKANSKAYGGSFNNPGFNALPENVQNKIKANSMGYGSNMYGYGNNMYDFGGIARGIGSGLKALSGLASNIPGVGTAIGAATSALGAGLENVGTGANFGEVMADAGLGALGGAVPGVGGMIAGAAQNLVPNSPVTAKNGSNIYQNGVGEPEGEPEYRTRMYKRMGKNVPFTELPIAQQRFLDYKYGYIGYIDDETGERKYIGANNPGINFRNVPRTEMMERMKMISPNAQFDESSNIKMTSFIDPEDEKRSQWRLPANYLGKEYPSYSQIKSQFGEEPQMKNGSNMYNNGTGEPEKKPSTSEPITIKNAPYFVDEEFNLPYNYQKERSDYFNNPQRGGIPQQGGNWTPISLKEREAKLKELEAIPPSKLSPADIKVYAELSNNNPFFVNKDKPNDFLAQPVDLTSRVTNKRPTIPTSNPTPVPRQPFYLHPHTGQPLDTDVYGRPPEGSIDVQFSQGLELTSRKLENIQKRKAIEEERQANIELLETMTPEQKADMRSKGLTPTQYMQVNTRPTPLLKRNGANIYTNGNKLSADTATNVLNLMYGSEGQSNNSEINLNPTWYEAAGMALPGLYNLGMGLFGKADQLNAKDFMVDADVEGLKYNIDPALAAQNRADARNLQALKNTGPGSYGSNALAGKVASDAQRAAMFAQKEMAENQSEQDAMRLNKQIEAQNAATTLGITDFNQRSLAAKQGFTGAGVKNIGDAATAIYDTRTSKDLLKTVAPDMYSHYIS